MYYPVNISRVPFPPIAAVSGPWTSQFLFQLRRVRPFGTHAAYVKLLRFFQHVGRDLATYERLAMAKALTTPLASEIFFRQVNLDISLFHGRPLDEFYPFFQSSRSSRYVILGQLLVLEMMLKICEEYRDKARRSKHRRRLHGISDPICFTLTGVDRSMLLQDAMDELWLNDKQLLMVNDGVQIGVHRWKELAPLLLTSSI